MGRVNILKFLCIYFNDDFTCTSNITQFVKKAQQQLSCPRRLRKLRCSMKTLRLSWLTIRKSSGYPSNHLCRTSITRETTVELAKSSKTPPIPKTRFSQLCPLAGGEEMWNAGHLMWETAFTPRSSHWSQLWLCLLYRTGFLRCFNICSYSIPSLFFL